MTIPWIHYLYPSRLHVFSSTEAADAPSWALVTGASDGIGLALSHELAMSGFNVVIHGRSDDKLKRVQSDLARVHPTRQFRTVTVDASSFTSADIDRVVAQIADVLVTVLINNVGGTAPLSSNFKYFESTTPEEIVALFSLNILFAMQLTRRILPQLQSQRRPAVVINVGSGSATGQPFMAAYSATKAALHTWTRSLAAEQRSEKTGVEVLETIVGPTYTQAFHGDKNFQPGLFMPTADHVARGILARVGYGHVSTTAYFWHHVQISFLSILPARLVDTILTSVLQKSVEAKLE